MSRFSIDEMRELRALIRRSERAELEVMLETVYPQGEETRRGLREAAQDAFTALSDWISERTDWTSPDPVAESTD